MEQVHFMEMNKLVGVCGSWIETFGNEKSIVCKYESEHNKIKILLFTYSHFANSSVIVRTEIFKKNNIRYNLKYKAAEDYDFWVSLSRYTRLHNIPKVLTYYRIHKNQTTKIINTTLLDCVNQIRLKQLDQFKINPTKEEQALHVRMLNGDIKKLSYKELLFLHNWIKKLYFKNKKFKIFESHTFFLLLQEYWKKIVFNFEFNNYNLALFFLIMGSKFTSKSKLTINQIFSLLFKCLFFKRNINHEK